MPIYEYACGQCQHQFELLVRSDTALECPQCHSTQLEKQLSVFATATAESFTPAPMASPCQSCGHPEGPGACAYRD